jgi:hypothetical protein
MLGVLTGLMLANYCKFMCLLMDSLLTNVSGGIDEQKRGGYTYISFAYGEKGPAVTVYYTPNFAAGA